MKVEIVKEKYNPLLKRKEIVISISHEKSATPTKASLQKFLSKMLNIETTHIEICNIFSKSGVAESEAKVKIWDEQRVKDLEEEAKKEKTEKSPETAEKVK